MFEEAHTTHPESGDFIPPSEFYCSVSDPLLLPVALSLRTTRASCSMKTSIFSFLAHQGIIYINLHSLVLHRRWDCMKDSEGAQSIVAIIVEVECSVSFVAFSSNTM